MAHRLKIVVSAWLVVVIVGSMEGPPAQAAQFHSEVAPAFLTGEQVEVNKFEFENPYKASFNCAQALASGSMLVKTEETLTLLPTYSQCKYLGLTVVTATNECKFTLGSLTGTFPNYDGDLRITCPAGKLITMTVNITGGKCTVEIPAQTTGGLVDYAENGVGSTRGITATWTVSNMTYVVSYVGAGTYCGKSGVHSDGKYSGSIVLKAFKSAEMAIQAGLWIE